MTVVVTAVLVVVIVVALAGLAIMLGMPVLYSIREQLRVDRERRLAEARIQRMTTEAMLRMLHEQRRP